MDLEQDLWDSTASSEAVVSTTTPSAPELESDLEDFSWDLADEDNTEGSLDPLAMTETTAGDLDAIVDAFDTGSLETGEAPIELEDTATSAPDFLDYGAVDGNPDNEPGVEANEIEADLAEFAIPNDVTVALDPDLGDLEFDPNLVFEADQELSVDQDLSASAEVLFDPNLELDSEIPEDIPNPFLAESPFSTPEEPANANPWHPGSETDPAEAYTLELESWSDDATPDNADFFPPSVEESWGAPPPPLNLADDDLPQFGDEGDGFDEAISYSPEPGNPAFADEQAATSPLTTSADTFEDFYDVDTLEVPTDFGDYSSNSDLASFDEVAGEADPSPLPPLPDLEEVDLAASRQEDSEPEEFGGFSFEEEPAPLTSSETNGFLLSDNGWEAEAAEPDATDEFIHKFAPVSPEEVAQRTPGRSSASGSPMKLILGLGLGALILALGGLGLNAFLGRNRQPEPNTAQPPQEAPTPADPAAAPPAAAPADPFREAVNAAQTAANLAQTAQTSAEWQAVADSWTKSIDLMKQVPENSPNHAVAQQKAVEYQPNLAYAQQNAQRAQ